MSRALRQTWRIGDHAFEAELRLAEGRIVGTMLVDGDELPVDVAATRLASGALKLELPERGIRAAVVRAGDVVWVSIEGRTYRLEVQEPGARAAADGAHAAFAASPMTGTLATMDVAAGDTVEAGAPLFIVEAMKMEYVVKAPRAVTIGEVRGAVGEQVEQGAVLITFESEAS